MSNQPITLHSVYCGIPIHRQAIGGARGRSACKSGGHRYIVDFTVYDRLKDAKSAIDGMDSSRVSFLVDQWAKRLEARKEILVGGPKA